MQRRYKCTDKGSLQDDINKRLSAIEARLTDVVEMVTKFVNVSDPFLSCINAAYPMITFLLVLHLR